MSHHLMSKHSLRKQSDPSDEQSYIQAVHLFCNLSYARQIRITVDVITKALVKVDF